MSLKKKLAISRGKNLVVDGELALIRFAVLKLNSIDEFKEEIKDEELGIVILSGEAELEVDNKKLGLIGPRKDVFEDLAFGAYLPGGLVLRIKALVETELALCYAPGPGQDEPRIIKPDELQVEERGKEHYRRKVVDIIVKNVNARHLLIGETFTYPGQWSSYPPHRHEKHNPPEEFKLEELYFYKVAPKQGFGFQWVYSDDRTLDEVMVVENNDLVLLPRGYHPVSAAPGYWVYYLWVLAGEIRKMATYEDPNHKWVHKIS